MGAPLDQRVGKAVVRFADSVVNLIVIAVLMCLLGFGGYSLWDSRQVYDEAASSNWTAYKPPASVNGGLTLDQLKALNPEVIGWLEVYGTDIDYPLTQSTDNMRYVNYNAKGEYSLSGCPFLDFENKPDFSDFNSIIYGHHMDVPAMFGELDDFEDKAFFDSHLYGTLYYGGATHGLEFFAFLSTDAYNSAVYNVAVEGQQARQEYLDNLYAIAERSRDIGVSTDDHIVLLSTCSTTDTNGRFIVAAKITDVVHDNPFAVEEGEQGPAAWSFMDWLRMVPWWAWVALGLLVLIVVLIVAIRRSQRRE